MVYCIGNIAAGICKIGVTTNLKQRLSMLKTGSHCTLEVFATLEGGKDLEAELHREFADDRLNGEWFELSHEIRQYFDIEPSDYPEELVYKVERDALEGKREGVALAPMALLTANISANGFKVLLAMTAQAGYNTNKIQLPSEKRVQIMEATGCNSDQLAAALKSLVAVGAIKKEGTVVKVNPNFAFKGSEARHATAMLNWK